MPTWLNWLGVLLCLLLVTAVPGPAIPVSVILVVGAVALRSIRRRVVAKRAAGN